MLHKPPPRPEGRAHDHQDEAISQPELMQQKSDLNLTFQAMTLSASRRFRSDSLSCTSSDPPPPLRLPTSIRLISTDFETGSTDLFRRRVPRTPRR